MNLRQNPENLRIRSIEGRTRGFALIVTLSLMILLSVVAVALMTLWSISLRTSGHGRAIAEARANARLALMLSIGELQKSTGPDTRITAPSTIVDPNNPPVTGVWRSWEGTDHEPNGRPTAPAYSTKRQAESAGGRFIGWLVSSAATNSTPPAIADPPNLVKTSPADQDGTVPLLAGGSLKSTDSRQVHLVPTRLENRGRFAWWISGENQKARLAQPYQPRTDTVAGLMEMGQSHTVANPEIFGLPSLLTDLELYYPDAAVTKPGRKALSRQTMALIGAPNPTEPQKQFHDFSSYSSGLLTNSATGGWRKDLSLLTETWDAIYAAYPGGKLPLFRFLPKTGATSQVPKPVQPASNVKASASPYTTPAAAVTAATPAQSTLYPWSDYSLVLGFVQPCTYHAASASWASLQSFATAYKGFTYYSGAVKTDFVGDKIAKQTASNIYASEIYNYKHKQRIYPQIARFQIIVYATAIEDPARAGQNPKKYVIQLMYVPFFVLWNPYNVTLEHTISGTTNGGQGSGTETNFLGIGWRRSMPGAMAIVDKATYPNPDSVPSTQFKLLTNGNFQTLDSGSNNVNPYDNQLADNVAKFGSSSQWKDLRTWGLWLPEGTLTFKPGEAKIFSPDYRDDGYAFGGGCFRMKEGYNPTQIVGGGVINFGSNLLATKNYWFLFRNDRVTQPYLNRVPGYGLSLSFGDGSNHFGGTAKHPSGPGDEYHNITSLANIGQGDKYWPPDQVDELGYSVSELYGQWIPLYSMSFGPRISIGTGPGTKQNRPTKGILQNDALASMVLSDPASGAAKDHPANNTFDFAYHSLSINSTITPNLSPSQAYIATGYQSGDGLSRLIMVDLPLRPMASLVELQGWNPRGQNPYPPFQMNLVGNSDATPLIPSNAVVPTTLSPSGTQYNLMHDDAYCANHLLFDDWFVSSIAPDPEDFGQRISRDINKVYRDFLKGESRLPNRAYLPISADSKLTEAEALKRAGEVIPSTSANSAGWLKVASRFEVEGMFNVNSTSVDAWKALLGHAKSRQKLAIDGADDIISKNLSKSHVVTRGAIAPDVEAGSGSGFGGKFTNASEYAGYRILNDNQIEDFAKKIVEQIRLRGPFLSLSEFVNRQLSTNKDLALAGAIQTALNNLTTDPMAKLRDPKNFLSDNTMAPTDSKLAGVNYAFDKAAEGSSAYGVPGWFRQADILRPIAPILSVRDDTFTIRTYGDSRDKNGNVVARAWCEAVVKRTRAFSDNSEPPDSIDPPAKQTNTTFGRRYEVVSFRWLNPSEV
jgi:hypothetical protein